MSGGNSPTQLEAATQRSRKISHPLSEQEVKDLKIVFDVFDVDSNGYIDRNELKRAMRCLGFKVSSRTIESMMKAVDLDGSGNIDFEEFQQVIINKQGHSQDLHAEMATGFRMMDKDGDGYISLKDLKAICVEVSENFSDADLQGMVEEADRDGDGLVNLEEFIQVMLKTNLFA